MTPLKFKIDTGKSWLRKPNVLEWEWTFIENSQNAIHNVRRAGRTTDCLMEILTEIQKKCFRKKAKQKLIKNVKT